MVYETRLVAAYLGQPSTTGIQLHTSVIWILTFQDPRWFICVSSTGQNRFYFWNTKTKLALSNNRRYNRWIHPAGSVEWFWRTALVNVHSLHRVLVRYFFISFSLCSYHRCWYATTGKVAWWWVIFRSVYVAIGSYAVSWLMAMRCFLVIMLRKDFEYEKQTCMMLTYLWFALCYPLPEAYYYLMNCEEYFH